MLSRKKIELIFAIAITASLLLSLIPLIPYVFPQPLSNEEPFSEIWVLTENSTAYAYPNWITANQTIAVNLGARNQMGYSMLYVVQVKLRNQSQPLPSPKDSTPSPLDIIHEFIFSLPNGGEWTSDFNFSILTATQLEGNTVNVTEIAVNGISQKGTFTATSAESSGEYVFQLLFELWYYDAASNQFRFHERFVSLWLLLKTQ